MKVCRSVSRPTAEDLVQRARDQVEAHADQPERSAGAGQQHLEEAAVEQRGRGARARPGSPARSGPAECRPRSGPRSRSPPPRRAADRASPSPCTPACRRTGTTAPRRTGSPGSTRPLSGVEWASTTSSKVRFMSSIIASRLPPLPASMPRTGRGVLSSSATPERLGQPPGRVDGEHDDLAPGLGGAQGERGRAGRLADAAGAADHDDPDRAGRRSARRRRGSPGGVRAPSDTLQSDLAAELVGDGEDRVLVDAAGVEGDLGDRLAEAVQHSASPPVVQRPGGLDARTRRPAPCCRLPRSRGRSRLPLPSANVCSSSSLSGIERTMLAITVPTAIWVGFELLDRLLGLGHRHVLQQRDQVHHGGRRPAAWR